MWHVIFSIWQIQWHWLGKKERNEIKEKLNLPEIYKLVRDDIQKNNSQKEENQNQIFEDWQKFYENSSENQFQFSKINEIPVIHKGDFELQLIGLLSEIIQYLGILMNSMLLEVQLQEEEESEQKQIKSFIESFLELLNDLILFYISLNNTDFCKDFDKIKLQAVRNESDKITKKGKTNLPSQHISILVSTQIFNIQIFLEKVIFEQENSTIIQDLEPDLLQIFKSVYFLTENIMNNCYNYKNVYEEETKIIQSLQFMSKYIFRFKKEEYSVQIEGKFPKSEQQGILDHFYKQIRKSYKPLLKNFEADFPDFQQFFQSLNIPVEEYGVNRIDKMIKKNKEKELEITKQKLEQQQQELNQSQNEKKNTVHLNQTQIRKNSIKNSNNDRFKLNLNQKQASSIPPYLFDSSKQQSTYSRDIISQDIYDYDYFENLVEQNIQDLDNQEVVNLQKLGVYHPLTFHKIINNIGKSDFFDKKGSLYVNKNKDLSQQQQNNNGQSCQFENYSYLSLEYCLQEQDIDSFCDISKLKNVGMVDPRLDNTQANMLAKKNSLLLENQQKKQLLQKQNSFSFIEKKQEKTISFGPYKK